MTNSGKYTHPQEREEYIDNGNPTIASVAKTIKDAAFHAMQHDSENPRTRPTREQSPQLRIEILEQTIKQLESEVAWHRQQDGVLNYISTDSVLNSTWMEKFGFIWLVPELIRILSPDPKRELAAVITGPTKLFGMGHGYQRVRVQPFCVTEFSGEGFVRGFMCYMVDESAIQSLSSAAFENVMPLQQVNEGGNMAARKDGHARVVGLPYEYKIFMAKHMEKISLHTPMVKCEGFVVDDDWGFVADVWYEEFRKITSGLRSSITRGAGDSEAVADDEEMAEQEEEDEGPAKSCGEEEDDVVEDYGEDEDGQEDGEEQHRVKI